MADFRISDLTEDSAPSLDIEIESERGGASYRNRLESLFALAYPPRNYLLNTGFDVYQRQISRTTRATKASGSYGPDRWYCLTDGTLQTRGFRLGDSGVGSLANGYPSFGEFYNNGGSTLGVCVLQVMPLEETSYLRGKQIYCSMMGLPSGGTPTLNAGLFEWTGTVGSSSAKSLVASWSSNVPTFNTTNHTQIATGSTALATSAWRRASATGSISGSATHVIFAVWSTIASGAAMYLSGAGAWQGSLPRIWEPRPNELELCRRFCFSVKEQEEASFGNSTFLGDGQVYSVTAGVSLTARVPVYHPPLRKAPNTTVASAAPTDWQMTDPGTSSGNSGNALSGLTVDTGRSCATCTVFNAAANHTGNLSTLAVGDVAHVISAAAAGASLLILDAED